MKLNTVKRIALCATMFGLVGAVTSQAVVEENQRELDIVIRDFDVTHPDFENFQESYYSEDPNDAQHGLATWVFPGYLDNGEWVARRNDPNNYACGNETTPMYGVPMAWSGYPHAPGTASGAVSSVPSYVGALVDYSAYAWYGEFTKCEYDPKWNPLGLTKMRGLVTDLCADANEIAAWDPAWNDREKVICTDSTYDAKKAKYICSKTVSYCHKTCKGHSWSKIVYVTPGMVTQTLAFPKDQTTGELDMYEPVITKARPACDNGYFEQWFSDVEGTNKRTNATLILNQDTDNPTYFEIDKNWNNGGYFPLDSISDDGTYTWVSKMPSRPNQFGAQSLSIDCPPYEYRWKNNQADYMGDSTILLCDAWKANGGPKVGGAALAAVNSPAGQALSARDGKSIGLHHLRNYGFTMMGYAAFKYKKGAGEKFEFAGDDDMWIYVDGLLVVDLGGTHLAAPGLADMDYLASQGHGCHEGDPLLDSCATKLDGGIWRDSSWHHLHFFYADRQTDGSNLRIRSSLSELAPSRYGQPAVGSVLAKLDSAGNQTVTMFLNTKLSQSTIDNIKAKGTTEPAILVMRTVTDPATGKLKTEVYGYYITDIKEGDSQGSSGVQYDFTGELRDFNGNKIDNSIIVGGDKIAFNFPYDQNLFVGPEYQQQKADYLAQGVDEATWEALKEWTKKVSFKVSSVSGKPVVGFPDTPKDWPAADFKAPTQGSPFVLDSAITRPDFSSKATKLSQIAESHGGELPLNYTADLLFTSVPVGAGKNGNPLALSNEEKKTFSGTTADGGLAAGTKAYVGGGDPKEKGMCFSNGTESCFSVSYPVAGPFRINIRVFDHLGHFVSQYQESMNEEELHKALGKNPEGVSCADAGPVYGATGAGFITVKMYPVSQSGKLIATGPYIYQVTFVEEAYTPCVMEGASAWKHKIYYSRTSETYRRGYKRAKTK